MGRRQTDSELSRFAVLIIFVLGCVSFFMFYFCFSVAYKPSTSHVSMDSTLSFSGGGQEEGEEERCCRGIEHLELWGDAVNWGANFKVNSSKECCMACKDTCKAEDRPCSCDSWVFCGDKQACGSRFGEVWLSFQFCYIELFLLILKVSSSFFFGWEKTIKKEKKNLFAL